jgi:hypothetical protein
VNAYAFEAIMLHQNRFRDKAKVKSKKKKNVQK